MLISNLSYATDVTLAIGIVLPLLIDLVTRTRISNKIKAIILPVLATGVRIGQAASTAQAAGLTFDYKHAVGIAAAAWGAGVFAHVAVWAPTNTSNRFENAAYRLKVLVFQALAKPSA